MQFHTISVSKDSNQCKHFERETIKQYCICKEKHKYCNFLAKFGIMILSFVLVGRCKNSASTNRHQMNNHLKNRKLIILLGSPYVSIVLGVFPF